MTDLSIIVFTLGNLPNSEPIFIREDEAVEIRILAGDAVPTWYDLLPKPLDYDNTEKCSPKSGPDCSVTIEWYWKEIPEWSGKHSVLFQDNTPQFELLEPIDLLSCQGNSHSQNQRTHWKLWSVGMIPTLVMRLNS